MKTTTTGNETIVTIDSIIEKVNQPKGIIDDLDRLLEIPPARPNLRLGHFRIIKKDDVNRKVSIAGSIRNYGSNLQAPFTITLGVTSYYYDGQSVKTITEAKTFEISGDVMILGNGSEFVTEPIEVPLFYINDHFENRYILEIIIDSDLNILRLDESDNYRDQKYFFQGFESINLNEDIETNKVFSVN